MKQKISLFEAAFLVFAVLVGGCVAWFIRPLVRGNADAVTLLATVFSILAGLLIGIVTLLSDASLVPEGGWRVAVLARPVLQRRLQRHRLLFLVYLLTLVLLLASTLVPDAWDNTLATIETAYLFFATIGFLYSFRLPWTLARIQTERLDAVIEERRQDATKEPSGGASSASRSLAARPSSAPAPNEGERLEE